MVVRIAPLGLQDYEGIIALWRRAGLTNHVHLRDSRRAFARQLGKRLVGTVLGTHDTRKGWINRLAVDPAYQRKGVGTRLLRASERALARKGMKVISAFITNGNARSMNLFRRSGYEVVSDMTYVRKKFDPDA
jgi:ribosomal protein S18 acetylase RimI-like enzyme